MNDAAHGFLAVGFAGPHGFEFLENFLGLDAGGDGDDFFFFHRGDAVALGIRIFQVTPQLRDLFL